MVSVCTRHERRPVRNLHRAKVFFPLPAHSVIFAAMTAVPIINLSPNPLPAYATAGSSGMDIRAWLPEPLSLQPLERCLVPTGIYVELPPGLEIQVRPRSGLALKNGITCLNSPGTVDSDYRGEIKVILVNLSNEMQKISSGDRIAQLVVQEVQKVEWKLVDRVETTVRSDGGFGHTGVQ
jgi:dUTP pyrophosphatase